MKVSLVAMGAGTQNSLTGAARQALLAAGFIAGAPRLLASLPRGCTQNRLAAVAPQAIADALAALQGVEQACVVFSGDTGFYSGAAGLAPLLAGMQVETLCGVSSVQLLAARLGRPWGGWRLVSAHGRGCHPVAEVLNAPEVFFLCDGQNHPGALCRQLAEAGLGEARAWVGENLGYPEEALREGTAGQLAGQAFAPLSVLLVENENTFRWAGAVAGLPDDAFLRGRVPMTKQEVRAAALAKLQPRRGDVLYDIGAGTGSVAVELALAARRGRVFAIEEKEEACELIAQNKERFGVYNLSLCPGAAPEALVGLPPPDGVFIGGSGGRLGEILPLLLGQNPALRFVVSAVTLETVAETQALLAKLPLAEADCCQISVARGRKAGRYTLLEGQNPVTLFSGRGAGL